MSIIETCAKKIFEELWKNYVGKVKDAQTIEGALRAKNDIWNEDHVAFRTFPGAYTGMHMLRDVFEALGYVKRDNFRFEDKQIDACWLEPPHSKDRLSSEVLPKVFISELLMEKFSPVFQTIIRDVTSQVRASSVPVIRELSRKAQLGDTNAADHLVKECISLLSGGAPWARASFHDYEILRKESEYAAWTLLFGHNINHFTVSAHLMNTFKDLASLNNFIQNELKIPMNRVGGVTKGSPELRLEQSSTLAAPIEVRFQDGVRNVPYAFVEFAFRWPLEGMTADKRWDSYYQSFVTNNADKIFESTNVR